MYAYKYINITFNCMDENIGHFFWNLVKGKIQQYIARLDNFIYG